MQYTRRGLARRSLVTLAASQARAQPVEDDIYRRLLRANEEGLRGGGEGRRGRAGFGGIRRVGVQLEALTAAYCAPESSQFKSEALLPPMEKASRALLAAQHPDGTIDSGNMNSPPDTGFVVETVCVALAVLRKTADARLDGIRANLDRFLLSAGEALATGGVHTPNHRWVICSALAGIHSLLPNAKYVNRIDDWLGEGIYQDADGQYAERSTGIYSQVEDGAFINVARLLQRWELLEPVRRNLQMNVYYTHPDGELETVASRRQDQNMAASISRYYLSYRYLAVRDANPLFAAVTEFIERRLFDQVAAANPVIHFLEEPLLRKPLPAAGSIPSEYKKVFAGSGVGRVRRGEVSATVYGGTDWPLGVASGLANNPTFFTFRKGGAVLESVRMGCNFFSLGVFRSEGLEVKDGAFTLRQRLDVPYYQPLPKELRNKQGDYPLTPARDGRFWSKLDFPRRPVGNVQSLAQKIVISEKNGVFELGFDIGGHDGVPVTIELAFRAGGAFEGTLQEVTKGKVFLLKEGLGKYVVGGDAIEFGPGQAEHQMLRLEGHTYAAHNGSLQPGGLCVYVTGFTPFRRTLTIRAAGA